MKFVDIRELYKIMQEKHICIFGAGKAGSAMFSYLKMHDCRWLFVADNDPSKHGAIDDKYEIGSFEKSVEMNTDIYFVGFLNNNIEKLRSVIDFLSNRGISKERIKCIDFKSDWVSDFCAEYTRKKLKEIKPKNKKEKKDIDRIILLGNLYNEDSQKKIMGGTTGAVNMQRMLLENSYKGASIECMMFPKNWITSFEELFNKYDYVLFSARFLESDIEKNNAVYISNDIFTAYIMARYRQKYILLYHGQGDFVSDIDAFGAQLTDYEKEFITYIEKEAIKYSYKTFFPSEGARIHFLNTISEKIDLGKNQPLYNSIYDFPKNKYKKNNNTGKLYFFSVGQMTCLKGMDQIPDFLNRVRVCTGKKIYWIVVANGELKDDIRNQISFINDSLQEHQKIEYEIIDYVVEHQKIYQMMAECNVYLMLHRISIFDFSTLEAMYMGKAIILSDVPGNNEFNIDDNILMVNEELKDSDIVYFIQNIDKYGEKNRRVYDENFSVEKFRERYYKVIDELMR